MMPVIAPCRVGPNQASVSSWKALLAFSRLSCSTDRPEATNFGFISVVGPHDCYLMSLARSGLPHRTAATSCCWCCYSA